MIPGSADAASTAGLETSATKKQIHRVTDLEFAWLLKQRLAVSAFVREFFKVAPCPKT